MAIYPGTIANNGIGSDAFKDATLQSGFALPSTITNIGSSAFAGTTLSTDFAIPASVTNIDATAFDGSTIPAGYHLVKDGQRVSAVTDGGHEYKVVKNITEDEFLAIYGERIFNHEVVVEGFYLITLPANFELPDTVRAINSSAFLENTIPAGFVLPASLNKIDAEAFKYTKLPIDFTISSTVQFIHPWAFNQAIIPTGYH